MKKRFFSKQSLIGVHNEEDSRSHESAFHKILTILSNSSKSPSNYSILAN